MIATATKKKAASHPLASGPAQGATDWSEVYPYRSQPNMFTYMIFSQPYGGMAVQAIREELRF